MDWFIPSSILSLCADHDIENLFRDVALIVCSNTDSEKSTRNVLFEMLLNAANRAALENKAVSYFRPCELVELSRLHVHTTPAVDFANWDSIKFLYPTEDSLVKFFTQIHLANKIPDLIIIEQLDRIIGQETEDFLVRLQFLMAMLTDTMDHINRRTPASPCRVLVSCVLPLRLWSGGSAMAPSLVPSGAHQVCRFTHEGDEEHFSLAEVSGLFEFKILLKQGTEILFATFLHNRTIAQFICQPETNETPEEKN